MPTRMNLIPAPEGYVAHYDSRPDGRPVVAFDLGDEGRPMVLKNGNDRAGLVPADQIDGYRAVTWNEDRPVSAVPGGGWLYQHPDGFVTSVVAWRAGTDGYMAPSITDGDGIATTPDTGGHVFHPDYPWVDDEDQPDGPRVAFGAWLLDQTKRDDPVGDFARDLVADDGCGRCANREPEVRYWGVAEIVRDLDDHSADSVAFAALERACAEWTARP